MCVFVFVTYHRIFRGFEAEKARIKQMMNQVTLLTY